MVSIFSTYFFLFSIYHCLILPIAKCKGNIWPDRTYKFSLIIRRFWGKGERWKQKREKAPPSPIYNLLSPSPLGRPDTQASTNLKLSAEHEGYARGALPRVLFTRVIYFSLFAKRGSVSQQPFSISRFYRVSFFLVVLPLAGKTKPGKSHIMKW